ncbi:MAG: sulfur carrier protein ThiS [Dictyoglomus sp.]|nr:sulfur carrier protein ThiS [Dictyoglomus sp.]MCX7942097.1 sulfur carrier protein ThiS [Dictyoglomaceae bacterium]MDW8187944.1 sulfur carrier protein ThiS [Dictyoglomus sp.]
MKIYVNDMEINFEGSIKELLEHLNYNSERIAILINGEIIKRDQWGTYKLKEKDYIEIVTLVGGG